MSDIEAYFFDLAIRALTNKDTWAFILTWMIILPVWTLLNIGLTIIFYRRKK